METVYILYHYYFRIWEEHNEAQKDIIGVFTDREKALKYARKYAKNMKYEILEDTSDVYGFQYLNKHIKEEYEIGCYGVMKQGVIK